MTKSILVLKIIFLSILNLRCSQPPPAPSITVPDLSSHLLNVLTFAHSNAGSPYTVYVIPEKSWLSHVTGMLSRQWHDLCTTFTLKNIGATLVSGVLSLGAVSYLLCAYVIYKVYHLVKDAAAWINWCSDDDLYLDDEVLYQKLALHRNKRCRMPCKNRLTLHQEKGLLVQYKKLATILKNYHLIQYFPHQERITVQRIDRCLQKLEKAESLCSLDKTRS